MSGSHTRRSLLLNVWVQLGLVLAIVFLTALVSGIGVTILWAAILLTLYSGGEYLVVAARMMRK